jgi:hypothetical protein
MFYHATFTFFTSSTTLASSRGSSHHALVTPMFSILQNTVLQLVNQLLFEFTQSWSHLYHQTPVPTTAGIRERLVNRR